MPTVKPPREILLFISSSNPAMGFVRERPPGFRNAAEPDEAMGQEDQPKAGKRPGPEKREA
jgi:hypothetical protein